MIVSRPRSHDERDKMVSATDLATPHPQLDADAKAVMARIIGAPRGTYVAARQAYASATALYLDASDAADAADETFDSAFRLWVRSATRADGKPASAELANLMGGTLPAELVDLPYRTEITKGKGLIEKLPAELKGDAAKLAAFQAALAAFEPLVDSQEKAQRDKLAAGTRLDEATHDFDSACGKLAKALKGLLGDEVAAAILPRFVRKDPGKGGAPTPTP
jgi:hypothetical protein